jgi:hypothetical protein
MHQENLFGTAALCTGFTIRWSVDWLEQDSPGVLTIATHWSKTPSTGAPKYGVTLEGQDHQLMPNLVEATAREYQDPGASYRLTRRLATMHKRYNDFSHKG